MMRGWLRRRRKLVDRLADAADPMARLLMDEAPEAMLLADPAGRIRRVNPSLRSLAGEVEAGAPVEIIFAEPLRALAMQALRPVLAGTEARARFATRLAAMQAEPPGPSDRAAEVTASALPGGGVLLRVADFSRALQMEAELAQGQRLQAIGQLAGGIAHDFNNLLTAISGAAELAEASGEAGPAARRELAQIRAAAGRGGALVRQLLAFARQQTLQPRVVPVNEAIADLAELLRRLLGERITLQLDLERPGRRVRVDPGQLDQALINLAVNARDAMPAGGTLTLRSGHLSLFRPLARAPDTIPPGRYVVIDVQDTGAGIPPEVLPRIFDPFFTTRRAAGGTGLGLSTVHGIMRQSGGFITIDSQVGQGTRVRLHLPRHDADGPPAPAAAETAPPVSSPQAAGRLVLLVEDEAPVRRLAEMALARAGWRVVAAATAEDGLEAARAGVAAGAPPALVISDVVMPGMDGPALVSALRGLLPGLPAVLVSGYAGEALGGEVDAARTGGPVHWLDKPYGLDALTRLAAQAVARENVRGKFLSDSPTGP